MISYEKAKMGKQLMKQFIAEGELEKAAFIGLIYQTPIRVEDVVTLKKSELDGRRVLKVSGKYEKLYVDRKGKPYRITRQLQNILNSMNGDSDMIFTWKLEYYLRMHCIFWGILRLHDFRKEYLENEVLLEKRGVENSPRPIRRVALRLKGEVNFQKSERHLSCPL